VREFEGKLLAWLSETHPDLGHQIATTGQLPAELVDKLKAAITEFKQRWEQA